MDRGVLAGISPWGGYGLGNARICGGHAAAVRSFVDRGSASGRGGRGFSEWVEPWRAVGPGARLPRDGHPALTSSGGGTDSRPASNVRPGRAGWGGAICCPRDPWCAVRRTRWRRPLAVGRRLAGLSARSSDSWIDLTDQAHSESNRVLATVLFTDIVDSTSQAAALGDRRWRDVREQHDRIVRGQLVRHRGREVKTMGDGFLGHLRPTCTGGPMRTHDLHGSIGTRSQRLELDCTPARSSLMATTSRVSRSRSERG